MASRSVALPPRFKCAVGGEWKASSEFSQNQLKKWTQKKRNDNDGITSINIGLVCKIHGGAPQQTTIKCRGPCGQMKVRDAFSKNQRNKPDAWCMRCTDWKERQQPDEIPTAPPNADVSNDELYFETSRLVDDDSWDLNNPIDNKDDDGLNLSGGEDDGEDDEDDEDIRRSVLRPTTKSVFRKSHHGVYVDDNDDEDDDDDEDDARKYVPGNSIVGLRPAPTPSIISLNSTQASYGGSQVSIVEEPRPIRPSYASAASVISTGTTQTARQNVPTGMTSSVTSGGKRSVAWVPPHLRGLDTSQRSGAPAGKEAPATVLPLPRPQLRGMAGPNPDTATPHLRGTQPSIASTDSRAGVQSFASSSAASTTGTDAVQPSNSHEYNAFSPLGQMYRQTTGGIPVDGTGTFMSGRKQIKVGRCGWQSGDNRKRFDVAPMFASTADEYVEPYESSGSDDEM